MKDTIQSETQDDYMVGGITSTGKEIRIFRDHKEIANLRIEHKGTTEKFYWHMQTGIPDDYTINVGCRNKEVILMKNGVEFAKLRIERKDTVDTFQWYKNGKEHHDTGPALLAYEGTKLIGKYWHQFGKLHREGKPALKRYVDGKKIYEAWYKNGLQHNTDGPAERRYLDGQVAAEMWYIDGKEQYTTSVIETELAKIEASLAIIREELAKK